MTVRLLQFPLNYFFSWSSLASHGLRFLSIIVSSFQYWLYFSRNLDKTLFISDTMVSENMKCR